MHSFLFIVFSSSLIILSSCAHHNDVRPSEDGVNKVVLQVSDKDQGYREAMSQANHYCKELGKTPVIVDEQTKYTGTMKEEDYNRAKTAAKVASAVGGAGYVFGGKNESKAGGIVGVGGGIANAALGEGYTFSMTFKCK